MNGQRGGSVRPALYINSEGVGILFRDYLRVIFEQIFGWTMQIIAGYFQIVQTRRCQKETQISRN